MWRRFLLLLLGTCIVVSVQGNKCAIAMGKKMFMNAMQKFETEYLQLPHDMFESCKGTLKMMTPDEKMKMFTEKIGYKTMCESGPTRAHLRRLEADLTKLQCSSLTIKELRTKIREAKKGFCEGCKVHVGQAAINCSGVEFKRMAKEIPNVDHKCKGFANRKALTLNVNACKQNLTRVENCIENAVRDKCSEKEIEEAKATFRTLLTFSSGRVRGEPCRAIGESIWSKTATAKDIARIQQRGMFNDNKGIGEE